MAVSKVSRLPKVAIHIFRQLTRHLSPRISPQLSPMPSIVPIVKSFSSKFLILPSHFRLILRELTVNYHTLKDVACLSAKSREA